MASPQAAVWKSKSLMAPAHKSCTSMLRERKKPESEREKERGEPKSERVEGEMAAEIRPRQRRVEGEER